MKKWILSAFVLLSASLVKGYACDGCNSKASPYTVMVILEAKSDKVQEMKDALQSIAQQSRQEDSCIEYHVHQDRAQPTKFALYEKWKSQELHKEQFTKPYIIEFMKQAEGILAGPYHGMLGDEIQ